MQRGLIIGAMSFLGGHGTNNSAGVKILVHNFKGKFLFTPMDTNGHWLVVVINHMDKLFVLCNVYGLEVDRLIGMDD